MKPLLSIVVPSKNRYYYLKFLVEYFNTIKSNEIELIIQDNSDKHSDNFVHFLDSINDTRISYSFIAEELSVIENCDLALTRAEGIYVLMIGDDDIFSKHIIDFLKKCDNKSIDAILTKKGFYNWPDVTSRFYKNRSSGLFNHKSYSSKEKTLNPQVILEKVISLGGTQILNLPRVYHGIVKKTILDKINKEAGSFFPGPSPDMANAIALCKYVNSFIEIDIPYIISGHSATSTGGQGANGQHFGEISNIRHLPKETAVNWSQKIPFYWSGYTIYGESVLQALKRMNMKEQINNFNFAYLYSMCLVYDINYRDRTKKIINEISLSLLHIIRIKIILIIILIWFNRILFHLKNNMLLILPNFIKRQNKSMFYCENILEVALVNDEFIQKNNLIN